jgi:hypothetical protein
VIRALLIGALLFFLIGVGLAGFARFFWYWRMF